MSTNQNIAFFVTVFVLIWLFFSAITGDIIMGFFAPILFLLVIGATMFFLYGVWKLTTVLLNIINPKGKEQDK